MSNLVEQLAQLLAELQHPESRRRRHLRRRLSAVEDHLLDAAIEELMILVLIDGSIDALLPLQTLLDEVQRRSWGEMRPSAADYPAPAAWDDSEPF